MGNINNFNLVSGTDILDLDFKDSYLYDASSFYNYEQDNIPIERLIGRTELLHQFQGFPGVTGKEVTMTLSSVADHSLGIYDNMDDIVSRIPQRLTFPLYIELCDYGYLGELNLDGISTVGDGQLHINNVLHSFDSSATVTIVGAAASPAGTVSSPGGFNTSVARDYMEAASSVRTGGTLFDNSQFTAGNGRMFASKFTDTEHETDRMHLYTLMDFSGSVGASNIISGVPYASAVDNTISGYDFEAKEKAGSGDSLETARDVIAVTDRAALNVYGNYFTGAVIRNCHGNIKLTGICIDGASGDDSTGSKLTHNTVDGFQIISSDIILEHAATSRCRETGFYIKNSDIGILGSMIGYRIYEKDSGAARSDTKDSVGLRAVNSNLTFTDEALGVAADADFNRFLVAFSRNDVGISLELSKVNGGVRVSTGKGNAGGADETTSVIQTYQNTNKGICLDYSEVSFLGRLDSFNNKIGLKAVNSTVNVPQFTFDDNQEEGVFLDNSILTYGYRFDELPSADRLDGGAAEALNKGSYHVSHNGVNLKVTRSSQVKPYYTGTSSLPDYIGLWTGHNGASLDGAMTNHGSKTGLMFDEPMIMVTNNSFVEILNAAFKADAVAPVRGKCIFVAGNSKAELRGSTVSRLIASLEPDSSGDFTASGLNHSFQSTAFAADHNSEIEISGPTKISRFGICVLAENNSHATFNTPLSEGGYTPAINKYDLTTSGNQTQVELHATRACVVVNKNSGLNMRNVGGTASSTDTTTDARYNDGSWADLNLSSVWNGVQDQAYIQFYPNPFTSSIAGEGFHEADVAAPYSRTARLVASGSEETMTGGGMVVRAVQGSYVDVDSVNFNFSMPASSVSGVICNLSGLGIEGSGLVEWGSAVAASDVGYKVVADVAPGVDPYTGKPLFDSGGSRGYTTIFSADMALSSYSSSGYVDPCSGYYDPSSMGSKLQLWNISDNSRINVSNVRINTGDPRAISEASGYHGPLGKWPNGVALDYFGKFGAATTYNGDDAFRNMGIFRLMLGHRADLKTMYAASAAQSGSGIITIGRDTGGYPIDQINSQGYMNITMDASSILGSDSRRIIGYDGGMEVTDKALSAYEDIHGFGIPAPGSGTPALMFPSQVAYYMRDLQSSGVTLMSSVPSFTPGPLHLDSLGYMRNFLDESGANLFSNAKHLSYKKINGVSIYRSTNGPGGEGRDGVIDTDTFGVGVRSLNLFDLNKMM